MAIIAFGKRNLLWSGLGQVGDGRGLPIDIDVVKSGGDDDGVRQGRRRRQKDAQGRE
ncbi:MAG: hypothetical protein R3B46_09585 [Phycisphaerales bacterium]